MDACVGAVRGGRPTPRREVAASDTGRSNERPASARRRDRRRVVHLVPALFDEQDGIIGGAERYALELAKCMARQVPTTLVTFGDRRRNGTAGALSVRVLRASRYVSGERTNPFAWRLFGALGRAAVIHCHQEHVMASNAAAIFAWLSNRRVFATDLGGGGRTMSGYVPVARAYDGRLHISEFARTVSSGPERPHDGVILGGVDCDRFHPASCGTDGEEVLFVGRVLPHKGIDDLVRGLPEGMSLSIVGRVVDGRYAKDLRALGRGKEVSFRQNVSDAELVGVYHRARCVVLPSVYENMYGGWTRVPELLGQVLLEAMACGVPVIGTRVGGIPEVIVDGVTGFLVDPNSPDQLRDRLGWFRERPVAAREMGRAGRKRVEGMFQWSDVVARCFRAYWG